MKKLIMILLYVSITSIVFGQESSTITASDFELKDTVLVKYIGTYTRANGGNIWTKQ